MNHEPVRIVASMAKRLLLILATMMLVWALAQTLPFDLAILLAGDTLLYAEIVSTVWIASRLANVKAIAGWARLILQRRFRRPGLRRALRSRARAVRKARSSDEDGRTRPALAFA